MDKPENIVTPSDLAQVFDGTNFGTGSNPREILNNNVLKCASNYATGHTIRQIMIALGLATKAFKLTNKGRAYLWAAYSGGKSL